MMGGSLGAPSCSTHSGLWSSQHSVMRFHCVTKYQRNITDNQVPDLPRKNTPNQPHFTLIDKTFSWWCLAWPDWERPVDRQRVWYRVWYSPTFLVVCCMTLPPSLLTSSVQDHLDICTVLWILILYISSLSLSLSLSPTQRIQQVLHSDLVINYANTRENRAGYNTTSTTSKQWKYILFLYFHTVQWWSY